MQVTHFGMVRVVDPLPVAKWAHHLVWLPPGSASNCPRSQLMILKFVFVEINTLWMKILQLKLSNSTSAEVYLMYYAAVWTQTVSYFLLTRLSSLDPARNVDWQHIVCVPHATTNFYFEWNIVLSEMTIILKLCFMVHVFISTLNTILLHLHCKWSSIKPKQSLEMFTLLFFTELSQSHRRWKCTFGQAFQMTASSIKCNLHLVCLGSPFHCHSNH